MRKKLTEIRPDIVHGQGTEKDCAISAVFSGFPSVITIHGNMRSVAPSYQCSTFLYNWLMAQLESLTIPRARGIVCITRYTQRAVADLARKSWLIPNAVDASYFEIARALESPPIILCVGTICPWKNQNALIESLDELAQREKFQLIFLGTSAKGDSYCDAFFDLLKDRSWCQYDGFANRRRAKTILIKSCGPGASFA